VHRRLGQHHIQAIKSLTHVCQQKNAAVDIDGLRMFMLKPLNDAYPRSPVLSPMNAKAVVRQGLDGTLQMAMIDVDAIVVKFVICLLGVIRSSFLSIVLGLLI
jgi:hypothetical protein